MINPDAEWEFIGVLQECELCHKEYPLSWIIICWPCYFYCYACAFPKS